MTSRPLPRDIRLQVIARDGDRCRLCNSNSKTEIHHKVPYLYGGKHTLDNLITLCKSCHKCIENKHLGFSAKARLFKRGITEVGFWSKAFELGLIIHGSPYQTLPSYHRRVLRDIEATRRKAE